MITEKFNVPMKLIPFFVLSTMPVDIMEGMEIAKEICQSIIAFVGAGYALFRLIKDTFFKPKQ
jgi:hypothetical protein